MEITIRKALPKDANAYTNCTIACWQAAYRGIVPDEYLDNMPTNKILWEKTLARLENPGFCEYYCVMHSNEMTGQLIVDTEYSEIWAIYLVKAFWGKGHGKKMLDFAINALKNVGHKQITLWVFETNHHARRFYEKHGFAPSGEKKTVEKYGGVPLVEMQYTLNLE